MLNVGRFSRRKFTLSAAAAAALISASPANRTVFASQDAGYPELMIIGTEYAFDMDESIDSGYTRITIDNQGAADHHAILFRINDDSTPEAFTEALMSGDLGGALALSSAYGGPNAGPGGSSSVIAYLDPGSYMAVCVVPDEDGIPHLAHGMIAPLEVVEGDSDLDEPDSDLEISLIDMDFVGLPEEVEAGSYTWKVTNDGAQLHEIAVLKLADGVVFDDLISILTGGLLESGEPSADPPFETVGGTAPKSLHAVNYLDITLEPGSHAAICFIPDVETGMPHFLMGMIAGFEVV